MGDAFYPTDFQNSDKMSFSHKTKSHLIPNHSRGTANTGPGWGVLEQHPDLADEAAGDDLVAVLFVFGLEEFE
jgi:hypothetical protein